MTRDVHPEGVRIGARPAIAAQSVLGHSAGLPGWQRVLQGHTLSSTDACRFD